VLLLIDREVLARVIVLALNHGVYLTQTVPSAEAAMGAVTVWRPHLAVVDMDAGGAAFMSQLRKVGADVGWRLPVVALTRRGDLPTKLDAFDLGVDDIMTVPFSPEELVARVIALLRRAYGEAASFAPVIRRGELEIDLLNRRVRAGEHQLHLTALEQSLLYLLAANEDRVVTREEILDHLWGIDFVAESNVVDRHVRSLRAKLQNNWREPRYVATVPGQGYRFLPMSEDEKGTPTGYPRGSASRRGRRAAAPPPQPPPAEPSDD
jgi:DNA-binding response OmpR family regulator